MTTEITQRTDDLHLRSRPELEEIARRWFDIAIEMKDIQSQLVEDLETALNACRSYQGMFAMMEGVNDPNLVQIRRLLTKYKIDFTTPKSPMRIFVDGAEITQHPDSIPGDAEVLELTSEEYYGTTTVELTQTEDSEFHLRQLAPENDE